MNSKGGPTARPRRSYLFAFALGLRPFRAARGDGDHGCTKNFRSHLVTLLVHLMHRFIRNGSIVNRCNRLAFKRIERLACRVDDLHSAAFKNVHELVVHGFHAVDQARFAVLLSVVDGALEVIDDGEQLLNQLFAGADALLLALLCRATTIRVPLGMQAQVLVLPVLRFGLRLGDQFVVGGGGFFGLTFQHLFCFLHRVGCGIGGLGGAALFGGAFLLACSVGILDGNLLAFGLRRALRLGRALLSHGYYFPSLSSTTS